MSITLTEAMKTKTEQKHREDIVIEPLDIGDFEGFVEYVNGHLSENGIGDTGYFQPNSRESPTMPPAKWEAYRTGLLTAVPEPGWRRAWVARSHAAIIGHIDLRARSEPFTSHRCLLGMGVHRDYRRARIGTRLLDVATAWAIDTAALDWIDLEVISTNAPAIRLYETSGFERGGELMDLFRIDGLSLGSRTMVKNIRKMLVG